MRTIEFIIETRRGLYRHEYTFEKSEFHVSKTPTSRLIELMTKYQNEGIIQYNMVVKAISTTLTTPHNLVCDVSIELNNEAQKYEEHYTYGPTGEKDFDLIGTPSAFLKNGLDYFDYDNVEEINIKIKRENV